MERIRQNLPKSWFHQVQYEWFTREYPSKKARDGAGNNTLTNRTDTRHRIRYKVGTTLKKTLLSVENEFYWHDSNDARNDFYDAQERKVTGISAEARYDDKYTLSSSVSYDLNDTWKLSYNFSFDTLSN